MTNIGDKFKIVLSKIGDLLISDDIKELKFLWGDMPAQEKEKVTTSASLFELLIKHGHLSVTKTEILEDGFRTRRLQPCLDLLTKFKDENAEELQTITTANIKTKAPCNIEVEDIVKHFQRTKFTEELAEAMEETDFITISGLLGCGKSQTALHYALKVFHQNHPSGLCWKVSCNDEITLLNSLSNFLNKISTNANLSKQAEDASNESSIKEFFQQIKNVIIERFSSECNLVILDDVAKDTGKLCKEFGDILTSLKVKVIVTTVDSTFCCTDKKIAVTGFSEDEAINFLLHGKKVSQKDKIYYEKLVHMLGNHPLLLQGAMTWMNTTSVTPKIFIRDLKDVKDLTKIVDETQKMFDVLGQYLLLMKKTVDKDVFDMVLAIKFLSLEDIPILFFNFFPTSHGKRHVVNANIFLAAIQRFSFPILRGIDDERSITIHLAVVKAIEKLEMTAEDNIRLLRKCLTAMMWLMDKENYAPPDYARNINLLPHAHSILRHVDIFSKHNSEIANDLEIKVLLAYVHDVVGYTFNFFGNLKYSGYHLDAAKRACFAILGDSEKNIEEDVHLSRGKTFESWENFADKEAGIIFEKLKEISGNEKYAEILFEMATELNRSKYRGQESIKLFQAHLEADLEDEYVLSEDEIEALSIKGLVMSDQNLGPALLYEIFLQVLYTYGRRVFYLDCESKEKTGLARDFTHSLFLAHYLGKRIAKEFSDWSILYVRLTEVSGVLLLPLEDKADLQLKTVENLEKSIRRFEGFLGKQALHFNFGTVKCDPFYSDHHKALCYKHLIKCITVLISIIKNDNDDKRKELIEQGDSYKLKLDECKISLRQEKSADLRKADFSMSKGKYEEAENLYRKITPEDLLNLELDVEREKLLFKDRQAVKGLLNSLIAQNKTDEAIRIARRVKQRPSDAGEGKDFDRFTKGLNLCIE